MIDLLPFAIIPLIVVIKRVDLRSHLRDSGVQPRVCHIELVTRSGKRGSMIRAKSTAMTESVVV